MKQNIFQRPLGAKWITYIGQFYEDWQDLTTPTPTIYGEGWTKEESAQHFVKSLMNAVEQETITITKAG